MENGQEYKNVSTRGKFFKALLIRGIICFLMLIIVMIIPVWLIGAAFGLMVLTLGILAEEAIRIAEYGFYGAVIGFAIWGIVVAFYFFKPIRERIFFLFGKNPFTKNIGIFFFSGFFHFFVFLILLNEGSIDGFIQSKELLVYSTYAALILGIFLFVLFSFQKEIPENAITNPEIIQKIESTEDGENMKIEDKQILRNPILEFFIKNFHPREYVLPPREIFEDPAPTTFKIRVKVLFSFLLKKFFVFGALYAALFVLQLLLYVIGIDICLVLVQGCSGLEISGYKFYILYRSYEEIEMVVGIIMGLFVLNVVFHVFLFHAREIKNKKIRLHLYDFLKALSWFYYISFVIFMLLAMKIATSQQGMNYGYMLWLIMGLIVVEVLIISYRVFEFLKLRKV